MICGTGLMTFYAPDEWDFGFLINPPENAMLPKLYDMRVQYSDEPHTDWYGPYAFTDEDVAQLTLSDHDKRAGNVIRFVEIREHQCDDPINGGCGHFKEGLPAPY